MNSTTPATEEVTETHNKHDKTAVADVLRENTDEYATLTTEEMGKPLDQALSEIEKCAWVCDYYVERTSEFLQDEHIGIVTGSTNCSGSIKRRPASESEPVDFFVASS